MHVHLANRGGAVLAVLGVAVAAVSAWPQGITPTSAYPDNYPPALPRRSGPPPPRVTWRRIAEIELPGPLPGDPPVLEPDGLVRIPVRGAVALVRPVPGAKPELEPVAPSMPLAPPAGDLRWVESADGRYRFRARPEGKIEAEKRCSWCRRGWRRAWTLRVAGGTPSAPLARRHRVLFAALDNLLYCVRRDNGHRVWTADLRGRVSRSPVSWRVNLGSPTSGGKGGSDDAAAATVDGIVVVPDDGESVIVLDPYDGSRMATLELPANEGWLVGGALVLPDGLLALARQGYERDEAALLLLTLERRTEDPPPAGDPGAL